METPDTNAEREIFAAAAALPPEERAAYLDSTCVGRLTLRASVEAWLDAHEPSDFMRAAEDELRMHPEEAGERIGNYKLLEKIGEGGFGVVWVADQERPVRRRVALKIIKLGMDTKEVIARFGQERQALAMMDHPHIAKVLDAGSTEWGRPYFVMELVRGIKITDYCDQTNLSTADRLALFIQVCQAVQHAHQKGIIHRDLKPSNILVTLHDGVPVPKVIDFGVAKATQQQRLADLTIYTEFQQMIGTPLYMSPEQAEMSGLDIDTRSDIYSLGVLLYELLTGRTPFDPAELMRKGYDEIRRAIREQEAQTPSMFLQTMADATRATVAEHRQSDPAKLTKLVRGDLDWIVMKALEKDRSRRYDTANGLAMDVQRHLHNEPVVARPPSNVYRFQKLVRRNKLAVVAAGVVAAVLVVGAVVSTWQAIRATRAEQAQTRLREEAESARNNEAQLRIQAQAEQKKAITEAARSAQVARFMQGMLNGVGPAVARGRDTELLREILNQTAGRLDELDAQPEVAADLRDTLGTVYRDLAEYTDAADMHRQALDLRKELHGDEHPSVATTLNKLGGVLHRQGKHAEAEKVYTEALAMQRKLLGAEHADIALTLNNLGSILRIRGKLPEAESVLLEALAMRRNLFGNEHVDVAESLSNLGLLRRAQGGDKLVLAEAAFRETLAMRKKLLGDDHPSVADTLGDLGRTLDRQGKAAEAETPLRESLALKKKLLSNEHPDVVIALTTLVPVLTRATKYADAEIFQHELLELQRKRLGPEHPEVITALTDLASLLSRQGKHAEVEINLREAILQKKKLVGEQDPSVAVLLEALGQSLSDGGKLLEAESAYRQVLELRKKLPEQDLDVIKPTNKIADLLTKQGRFVEAEAMFRETLAAQKKRFGDEHSTVAYLLEAFGEFLRVQGKPAAAEIILREAVEMRKKLSGNEHRELTFSLRPLGMALLDQQKFVDAESIARQNLALVRKFYGAGGTASALRMLGVILVRQGKYSKAEPIVREGAELGSGWCQEQLGFLYLKGYAVTQDSREAFKWYRKAAENAGPYAQFYLGRMYATGEGVDKDLVESARWYRKFLDGGAFWVMNDAAWLLATSAEPAERDGMTAVTFAEKAVEISGRKNPEYLDTLAAAYAEVGQFEKAISAQQEAIALLKDENLKKDFASRVALYQSGMPYRNADSLAIKVRELLEAGMFEEAEPLARQCLAIREQQIPNLWPTFNARSLVGCSLLGQKKFTAAEPMLLAGYEGLKQREDKIPANGKVNLKKFMQSIVQLYETTARPEQAADWKKKLSEFDPPAAGKKAAAEQP